MLRSTSVIWISTTLMIGVVPALGPAQAAAQPPKPTRKMDSPIRGDRWTQRLTVEFTVNDFVGNGTVTPDIPEGKKLFLQSVSLSTVVTDGQSLMQATVGIVANPTDPAALASFYVAMDFQATSTGQAKQRLFIGNRDINMVVHRGEIIRLGFFRNGDQGGLGLNFSNVTLVGFLVDAAP